MAGEDAEYVPLVVGEFCGWSVSYSEIKNGEYKVPTRWRISAEGLQIVPEESLDTSQAEVG